MKPNQQASNHRTLIEAVSEKNLEKVRALIKEKKNIKNINLQDELGHTVLHMATINQQEDMILLLLSVEGIKVDIRNQVGETPLHIAIKKVQDPQNVTVIQSLNEKGANGAVKNIDGETPWHVAMRRPELHIRECLFEIFEKQTQFQDVIKIPDDNGNTLLHIVSACGHFDIAKKLIEAGADKNAVTRQRKTPLHLASQKGRLRMVEFLLNEGAHLDKQDREGKTALEQAEKAAQHNVVGYLKRVTVEQKMGAQVSDFHRAIREGNMQRVKHCVERDVLPIMARVAGKTALDVAKHVLHELEDDDNHVQKTTKIEDKLSCAYETVFFLEDKQHEEEAQEEVQFLENLEQEIKQEQAQNLVGSTSTSTSQEISTENKELSAQSFDENAIVQRPITSKEFFKEWRVVKKEIEKAKAVFSQPISQESSEQSSSSSISPGSQSMQKQQALREQTGKRERALRPEEEQRLLMFCDLLDAKMSDLLLKSLAISKGLLDCPPGMFEKIGDAVKFGGELIPLPYAALAVNVLTNAGVAVKKQHEKERQNSVASYAHSIHDASDLVRETATLFTQRHQMQILKLTDRAVELFAESVVKRMFNAMSQVSSGGKLKSVLIGMSTGIVSFGEGLKEMLEENVDKMVAQGIERVGEELGAVFEKLPVYRVQQTAISLVRGACLMEEGKVMQLGRQLVGKFSTRASNCLSSSNKYLEFYTGATKTMLSTEEVCRYSDVLLDTPSCFLRYVNSENRNESLVSKLNLVGVSYALDPEEVKALNFNRSVKWEEEGIKRFVSPHASYTALSTIIRKLMERLGEKEVALAAKDERIKMLEGSLQKSEENLQSIEHKLEEAGIHLSEQSPTTKSPSGVSSLLSQTSSKKPQMFFLPEGSLRGRPSVRGRDTSHRQEEAALPQGSVPR